MHKIEDGTYEIFQEDIKINPSKKKEYYESILNQIPKQEHRRSFEQPTREKSNTYHGIPENYKFLESDIIGEDKNLDDSVRNYINEALEEADLIRKMDEKQVEKIKDSRK